MQFLLCAGNATVFEKTHIDHPCKQKSDVYLRLYKNVLKNIKVKNTGHKFTLQTLLLYSHGLYLLIF